MPRPLLTFGDIGGCEAVFAAVDGGECQTSGAIGRIYSRVCRCRTLRASRRRFSDRSLMQGNGADCRYRDGTAVSAVAPS
jgi:hypothetical protein